MTIVISLFYFLAFFLPYLSGFFDLISTTQLFFPAFVNVLGQNHRVIITSYDDLTKGLAAQGTITSVSQISGSMGCLIDDTGTGCHMQGPITVSSSRPRLTGTPTW